MQHGGAARRLYHWCCFSLGTANEIADVPEESNGKSDGVKSIVKKFTTPGPGERIVNDPK